MSIKVTADGLAAEVVKVMEQYQGATFTALKNAVDATAKNTVKHLNRTSPKRSGKYAKNWADKKDKKHLHGTSYTRIVYNIKHYRLTHLLEKGHDVKSRGRIVGHAGPIEHIAKAEQEAIDELVQNLKENL